MGLWRRWPRDRGGGRGGEPVAAAAVMSRWPMLPPGLASSQQQHQLRIVGRRRRWPRDQSGGRGGASALAVSSWGGGVGAMTGAKT